MPVNRLFRDVSVCISAPPGFTAGTLGPVRGQSLPTLMLAEAWITKECRTVMSIARAALTSAALSRFAADLGAANRLTLSAVWKKRRPKSLTAVIFFKLGGRPGSQPAGPLPQVGKLTASS